MSSTVTDRIDGLSSSVALKAPCRVATTTNIELSGLKTINGTLLASRDRVLVKDQTIASENGIYVASSTAWARALDFNGARDVVKGTGVRIADGSVTSSNTWVVISDNPINIGTDAINWRLTTLTAASPVKYESFVAAYSADLSAVDSVETIAFLGGWAGSTAGPRGKAKYHKDGTTGSASTAYSDSSGFYDASGDGFSLSRDGQVNVLQFGATGDGVTDDSTAIQNATNASSNKSLLFPEGTYLISSTLQVPAGITILGYGAKIKSSVAGDNAAVLIQNNNVSIYGLEIEGIGNSSYVDGNNLIEIMGTDNSPAAPTYLTGTIINDCTLHDCGGVGIFARFVESFDFDKNIIYDCGLAGIMGLSCQHGSSDGCVVRDITPGSGGGDAYGITYTKSSSPLVEDPISRDITCNNNRIFDIPLWTALDTHGGERITFSGNTIKNCRLGVALVKADDGAGNEVSCASWCTVTGNTMEGNNQAAGIVISGSAAADSLYGIGNAIVGNTVRSFGDSTSAASGAILISSTKATNISANVVEYAGANGINLDSHNLGVNVNANTIKDSFSATVTAAGIIVGSTPNEAFIGGNFVIRDDTAKAANVMTEGITVFNNANNVINIGAGYNEAVDLFNIGANAVVRTDLIEAMRVDNTVTAGVTRMHVYDVDNGQLERVRVGAADSGGSGFKVLRISN